MLYGYVDGCSEMVEIPPTTSPHAGKPVSTAEMGVVCDFIRITCLEMRP